MKKWVYWLLAPFVFAFGVLAWLGGSWLFGGLLVVIAVLMLVESFTRR